MTAVTVVRITMPFFPMRPRTGRKINAGNVEQVFADATSGQWHPQRKLNGDRAVLAIQDNRTMIISRYGDIYRHPVDNIKDFLKLPNGTLLDGEVWKKRFYPFEALGVEDVMLWNEGPAQREKAAQDLVAFLKHEWIFHPPTLEWMKQLQKNLPNWEGLVLKRTNSPYVCPGSSNQENATWQKVKWV